MEQSKHLSFYFICLFLICVLFFGPFISYSRAYNNVVFALYFLSTCKDCNPTYNHVWVQLMQNRVSYICLNMTIHI